MTTKISGYYLSPQQKSTWKKKEEKNYISYAVTLEGTLCKNRLEESLQILIEENTILRTNFINVEGVEYPLQTIRESQQPFVKYYDLRGISGQKQIENKNKLYSEVENYEFDLKNGNLVSFHIILLEDTRFEVVINANILITDYSIRTIALELFNIYENLESRSKQVDLENRIQYYEVGDWLNDILGSPDSEFGKNYWGNYLSKETPCVELPFKMVEKSNALKAKTASVIEEIELGKISNFATDINLDLYSTLLSSWNVILHRYTLHEKLMINTYINGRRVNEEFNTLIGPLNKYVPLLSEIEPNSTFIDIAKKIHHKVNENEEWYEFFETSQHNEILNKTEFGFTYIEEMSNYNNSYFSVKSHKLNSNVDSSNLNLFCYQNNDVLTIELKYNASLYNEEDIRNFTNSFINLISNLPEECNKKIQSINLLNLDNEDLMTQDDLYNSEDYNNRNLYQLFVEQVKQTPEATAIKHRFETLSYKELNTKVNQLSSYLVSKGVQPGQFIGIHLEKSTEFFISILSILKTGAAYVPIDPVYPEARINYIIEDSNLNLLITDTKLVKDVSLKIEVNKRVLIDKVQLNEFENSDMDRADFIFNINTPAYVIYTSGSTGKPKGVVVSHRAVCNHMLWMLKEFPLDLNDKILQRTSLSFDASVWEVFAPLLSGATLVIADNSLSADSDYLIETIKNENISTIQTVPTLLKILLDNVKFEECKSLKRVFCGGETLTKEVYKDFLMKSKADIINLYGPTETCIDATFWCDKSKNTEKKPYIGKPITNTNTYILDQSLNIVPPYVPGELYISGEGLANGYLNQPKLTAEKFIPNPFSNKSGERLYKTGDVGRYLPDGNIEFMGRIDNQVKVRGYRIELEEIEYNLNTHLNIRGCTVVIHEAEDQVQQLVAYVVGNDNLEPAEIHQFLENKLPEYMIPDLIVFLDELPTHSNGKIDKNSLPDPLSLLKTNNEYEKPSNNTEELIFNVWAKVLRNDSIGVNDDFFELGGHSLIATQVITRLNEIFNIDIPLRGIFENTSIRELANYIDKLLSSSSKKAEPEFKILDRDSELPLSFAQQRLWFLNELEPNNPLYNMVAGFRMKGNLNIEILKKSLQEIVNRHETLRTTFYSINDIPKQKVHSYLNLEMPVVTLEEYSEESREEVVLEIAKIEANTPFNLSEGPLIRSKLISINKNDHLLIVNIHHIINDGWSRGIFIKELSNLYNFYTGEITSSLEDLTYQYADFAAWQRKLMTGANLTNHLNYWKNYLKGDLPVLQLPTDYNRSGKQNFVGKVKLFNISDELTTKLKEFSKEENSTLFMTLFSTFNLLLYHFTGEEDILVGSPIANRNNNYTENLIGFFVNTLVLRTNLSENPTFRGLLKKVRENLLSAYTYQDLPFEKLVEELCPERDTSHSPLFKVMFALHNTPASDIEMSGLSVTPITIYNETAKFDITLELLEDSNGIIGELEYNTSLFKEETIICLWNTYISLLNNIILSPEEEIKKITLISQEDKEDFLNKSNDNLSEYPSDKCVHEIFEQYVKNNPNKVAIHSEEGNLTYYEVNQYANYVAKDLKLKGIVPGNVVGVCMERSNNFIVSILAILKMGATYVPIDPNYPEERIKHMLNNSNISYMLTNRNRDIGADINLKINTLNVDIDIPLNQFYENPNIKVSPKSIAYVIYTSGSTGLPKGVMVPHYSIGRLAINQNYVTILPDDKVAHLSNVSFDAATFEIWGSLLNGASLVIVPKYSSMIASDLSKIIKEQGINIMFLTTALFNNLSNEDNEIFKSLRLLLFGGEVANIEYINKVIEKGQPKILGNIYGPTENTTFTSWYQIDTIFKQGEKVPIGKPISNTQTYVLNEYMQPVPPGVPGELYIGGEGLAYGYINQPELTAEKFVPNPYSNRQGQRLYKTGDVVRCLPDGNIEFLGRVDDQVKIRGYRIELGEVENTLNQHPNVQKSVVLVNDNKANEKDMSAYVVPNYNYSDNEVENNNKQVDDWEMIFNDHIYDNVNEIKDFKFNTQGWNSTYTNEAIPKIEMEEWLKDTVNNIISPVPKRVLEIGCGTGMIMYSLLDQCEKYVGTDISDKVINTLKNQLANIDSVSKDKVKLFKQDAMDFKNLKDEKFDLIVLNSVIQYFPSYSYLLDVLEQCLSVLDDEGKIFLGDIRNYDLLKEFHTSVKLFNAKDNEHINELSNEIQQSIEHETELLISPDFFASLKEFTDVNNVSVRIKRGSFHNELTKYRYNVVLNKKSVKNQKGNIKWLNGLDEDFSLKKVENILEGQKVQTFAIKNIVDSRILEDLHFTKLLEENISNYTIEELKKACPIMGEYQSNDPENFYRLSDEYGYNIEINRYRYNKNGTFNVIFSLDEVGIENARRQLMPKGIKQLKELANKPYKSINEDFKSAFKLHLKKSLPDYMIPNQIFILDEIPINQNGKIDKNALKKISSRAHKSENNIKEIVSPKNMIEQVIKEVWVDILSKDEISIKDNFFEIGGHSLLATQVISRLKNLLEIEIPLKYLFENPTIENMGKVLEEKLLLEADM